MYAIAVVDRVNPSLARALTGRLDAGEVLDESVVVVGLGSVGMLTALLFTIGKYGLGLYLGRSSVSSAYGAVGSLVIVLLWVYYSAQILFFGAEFTQVYANRYGSRIVPDPITAEVFATSIAEGREPITESQRKAVLLGNAAAQHPQAGALLALASWIAEQTGASCGYLGDAGNSVGAQLVRAMPGDGGLNAAAMTEVSKRRRSSRAKR